MDGKVHAASETADLDFEVRLPDPSPDSLDLLVRMDASGSLVELRDQASNLLVRLDGRQLDSYYRAGKVDPSSMKTLKQSIIDLWKQSRSPVEEPISFRLDLSGAMTTDELIGRVKLLLDFLIERAELDVLVKKAVKLSEDQSSETARPGSRSLPESEPAQEEKVRYMVSEGPEDSSGNSSPERSAS